MQTVIEYNDLMVPDYALSYLVNCDDSGITAEDKAAIDAWFKQFTDEAAIVGAHVIFSPDETEGSFVHRPEFGLACNCVKSTVLIVN